MLFYVLPGPQSPRLHLAYLLVFLLHQTFLVFLLASQLFLLKRRCQVRCSLAFLRAFAACHHLPWPARRKRTRNPAAARLCSCLCRNGFGGRIVVWGPPALWVGIQLTAYYQPHQLAAKGMPANDGDARPRQLKAALVCTMQHLHFSIAQVALLVLLAIATLLFAPQHVEHSSPQTFAEISSKYLLPHP